MKYSYRVSITPEDVKERISAVTKEFNHKQLLIEVLMINKAGTYSSVKGNRFSIRKYAQYEFDDIRAHIGLFPSRHISGRINFDGCSTEITFGFHFSIWTYIFWLVLAAIPLLAFIIIASSGGYDTNYFYCLTIYIGIMLLFTVKGLILSRKNEKAMLRFMDELFGEYTIPVSNDNNYLR